MSQTSPTSTKIITYISICNNHISSDPGILVNYAIPAEKLQ